MKKNGFTLIELLIVTVVIVTLMGIVFRLAGLGGESRARSVTADRLQRIENALSGYYAAFGSYPPVPLYGYRSIYMKCNDMGIQYDQENRQALSVNNSEILKQVEAACRSQPLGVRYPYPQGDIQGNIQTLADGQYDALPGSAVGRFGSSLKTKASWEEVRVFQFGLLSFLLPRYLFMLGGGSKDFYDGCAQWEANNRLPCRLDNGKQFPSWKEVRKRLGYQDDGQQSSGGTSEACMISNMLSQAVCARWMANFEHTIDMGRTFYGVDTKTKSVSGGSEVLNKVFSPGSARSNNSSQKYILDGMTITDGWGREFYYYSPAPYQSCRVWSAGADGRTFPPWIDLSTLDSASDRRVAARWLADDVVGLSAK